MTNIKMIQGTVTPGFEKVEEQFKKNFIERGEIGAACTIYLEGQKAVDLWGGYKDKIKHHPGRKTQLFLYFQQPKDFLL